MKRRSKATTLLPAPYATCCDRYCAEAPLAMVDVMCDLILASSLYEDLGAGFKIVVYRECPSP
jgi:hypothetical protein